MRIAVALNYAVPDLGSTASIVKSLVASNRIPNGIIRIEGGQRTTRQAFLQPLNRLLFVSQDKVNPSSVILSGVMMLDHLGWGEAARMIDRGISRSIAKKQVTYDFHRLMDGATLVSCSGFAKAIVEHM